MPDRAIVDNYDVQSDTLVQAEGTQDEILGSVDRIELILHRSTLLNDVILAFCDQKVFTSTLFI